MQEHGEYHRYHALSGNGISVWRVVKALSSELDVCVMRSTLRSGVRRRAGPLAGRQQRNDLRVIQPTVAPVGVAGGSGQQERKQDPRQVNVLFAQSVIQTGIV